MDPFSIAAATVGVADVCVRLIRFLHHVKESAKVIDEELHGIAREISSLDAVNQAIRDSFPEHFLADDKSKGDLEAIANLWKSTAQILHDCESSLAKLENLLENVIGDVDGIGRFDSFRKWLRKLSKEDEFSDVRQKLNTFRALLQVNLTAINM
jgi:hypothetical protein